MATMQGGKDLEAKLRALAQKVASPATLRVGFLEGATYPDGKPVAMIAAIQDFGAPRAGIPPRPFFRNMIAAKKGEWPGAIARAPRGDGGFGYDPIFVPAGSQRSAAELSPAEKDAASHRGRALGLLVPALRALNFT